VYLANQGALRNYPLRAPKAFTKLPVTRPIKKYILESLEKKMKDKKEEEKDAKINKKDEEKFESLTEQASDQRSSVCFFIQAQLLQDNSTSTLQRQPRKLSLHTGRGFAYSLFGCSENNNGKGHSC